MRNDELTFSKPKETHGPDKVFRNCVVAGSLLVVAIVLSIFAMLLVDSWPALTKFGIGLVFNSVWDPVKESYGGFPVIYGTLVSSFIAVLISAPISIALAIFAQEILPNRMSQSVSFIIQLLAAIPSVVYGLWGIFVLAPWLKTVCEPLLYKYLGFLPFFQGPMYGVGMLSAGLILAIMITPTISSISQEVIATVPKANKEAALALGATKLEMIRIAVLGYSRNGIYGGIILALGRALGETMAVTMVIGNRAEISASLFAPGQTMASVLANEYAEVVSSLHMSALASVGLILFVLTLGIYFLSELFVNTSKIRRGVM